MLKKHRRCFINESDRCRLGALLHSADGRAYGSPSCLTALNARLEDAHSVAADRTPTDIVTMNSTVELCELQSTAGRRLTLVYPTDADFGDDCISVFEPLGTQLLGSKVGDVVHCNNRPARIARIVYQPERAGHWRR
jgi:regulator of nucleoside diphosphate kinase